MSDEAAFLRAIQADPTDATAKFVYADWLDEHGEGEKAEWLRLTARTETGKRASSEESCHLHAMECRHRAWVEVARGSVPMWDEVTMFALGRLRGLLDTFAALNTHDSDISYDFDAHLRPRAAGIEELVVDHFGADYGPANLEPLANWEDDLGAVLREWLFHDLRHLANTGHRRLAVLSAEGRELMVADALEHVRSVMTPTAGYRVEITRTDHFYALNWADVALESADRVLFLHFSFSD